MRSAGCCARSNVRDVLGARLAILDAEIAAKQRAAAVLRATLTLPHLDVDTMRRYWKMSKVNNEQMKALVAAFIERVTSGAPGDDTWRSRTAAAAPALPEHPTPAQVEAWTELAGMLQDQDVVREFETRVSAFWEGARDPEGVAAGRAWLEASARAMGRAPDGAFVQWLQDQYAAGGSRARFQELLAVLTGDATATEEMRAWRWLIEAARAVPQDGR